MDARITKQRLSNLLSYDWLKIIATIAAAVAMLVVLFTIIRTSPTIAQQYVVFSWGSIIPAQNSADLAEDLKDRLSYDILKVEMENFADSTLGNSAFEARRGVLKGSALFVSNYHSPDLKENEMNDFERACNVGLVHAGMPIEYLGLYYDLNDYFSGCEEYLVRFFGEEWETAPVLDGQEVEDCFLARNGKDKRFKTNAQKEAGIALEEARLNALREDYIFVRDNGFEKGFGAEDSTLTFTTYTSKGYDLGEDEHVTPTYTVGINLGKLSKISDLFYYKDASGNRATAEVTLLLFDNGERLNDLKYESVTMLRYLLEKYAK